MKRTLATLTLALFISASAAGAQTYSGKPEAVVQFGTQVLYATETRDREVNSRLREYQDQLRAVQQTLEKISSATPGPPGNPSTVQLLEDLCKSLLTHAIAEAGPDQDFAAAHPDWTLKVYRFPAQADFLTKLLPQALPPGSRIEMDSASRLPVVQRFGNRMGGKDTLLKRDVPPSLVGVYTSPQGHKQVRELIASVRKTLSGGSEFTAEGATKMSDEALGTRNVLLQVLILAEAPKDATLLFVADPSSPTRLGLSPADLAFLGDRWVVDARGVIRVTPGTGSFSTSLGSWDFSGNREAPSKPDRKLELELRSPLSTSLELSPDRPVLVGSLSNPRTRSTTVVALRATWVE